MKKSYDIAIIGQKETILGFKSLGLTPVPVMTAEQALKKLHELKNEKVGEGDSERQKYAIIFIIEEFARAISAQDYKKLSNSVLPAIIPIPGPKGSSGFGNVRIAKMVERAVGSDIFGDK